MKLIAFIVLYIASLLAAPSLSWLVVACGAALWLALGGGAGTLRLAYLTLPRDVIALLRYLRLRYFLYHMRRGDQSVADVFDKNMNYFPDKTALIHEGRAVTFRQLGEEAARVAHVLSGAGLGAGDTLALFMCNRPQFVATWLGASKAGVRTALINTNLRDAALLHCVTVAGARALVAGAELGGFLAPVAAKLPKTKIFIRGFDEQDQESTEYTDMAPLLRKAPTAWTQPNKMHFEDVLLYIFTSGTTGLPKAAIITNARYMFFCAGTHFMTNMKSEDIIYNPLPLYHTAGGMVGMGQVLVFRCTAVTRSRFSASRYWAECEEHACTVAQYVGELCRYLLKQPANTRHQVRLMFGNGVRAEVWTDFTSRFNIPVVAEFYGATESNANIVNFEGKPGACGFLSVLFPWALPIKLIRVDPATGQPVRGPDGLCVRCEPGETGEFVGRIKRHDPLSDFYGYAGNKKETDKKVVKDVFSKGDQGFLSGDLLTMDELGYVFFKDRTGDTFRWRGENVSTQEVEGAVMRAAEGRDAVVFGVTVPGCEGKAGMAVLVGGAELPLGDLRRRLTEALPPYAVPVFLRLGAAIDATGTFKLKKKDLQTDGYEYLFNKTDAEIDGENCYFLTKDGYQKLNHRLLDDIQKGCAGL